MDNHEIPLIEVKITGREILPGDIRSKDIAEIIISIEKMIISYISSELPLIKEDEILIGLQEIRKGSIDLLFKPREEISFDTFIKISSRLSDRQFHLLPKPTREQLIKIQKLSTKLGSNIEFRSNNGKSVLVYKVDQDSEFIDPPIISGETILYGEVIRVGGKNDATVKLSLDNGEELTCEISFDLAKKLGAYLYREVGVIGNARWHSDTLELVSFSIKGITNYRESSSIKEGISKLSDIIGRYYEDLDDPTDYFNKLRYGDEK